MELLICGSAASEGIPALFCKCPICEKARCLKGKEVRSRTAYQLGERVRVDFGPDSLMHQFRYDLRYEKLRHLFITHSHRDHYYPVALGYRMAGFSHVDADNIMNLYGNQTVLDMLNDTFKNLNTDFEKCRLNPIRLAAGKVVEMPDEKMTFLPIPAHHVPTEEAFIFAVKKEDTQILIGNDSGYFNENSWQMLGNFKFDVVILDDTGCGLDIGMDGGHLGGKFVIDTVNRMRKHGMANHETVFVVNHFSHNGKMNHCDLEKYFKPQGIQVAFDGMTLPI